MTKKTGHKSDQFHFRIPEELRAEIAKIAEKNNRSIGGEIRYRLENSLLDEMRAKLRGEK